MRTETITCDLCGGAWQTPEPRKKRIEGIEYDVHESCWTDFMARLDGKGREDAYVLSLRATGALPPRTENVGHPTTQPRGPLQRIKAYAAEIRALTEKIAK